MGVQSSWLLPGALYTLCCAVWVEFHRQPKHGEERCVEKAGDRGDRCSFHSEHHESEGVILQATRMEPVGGHGRLAIGAGGSEADVGDGARIWQGREELGNRPAALVTQREGWHGEDSIAFQ